MYRMRRFIQCFLCEHPLMLLQPRRMTIVGALEGIRLIGAIEKTTATRLERSLCKRIEMM
jgi:hypothetical protein